MKKVLLFLSILLVVLFTTLSFAKSEEHKHEEHEEHNPKEDEHEDEKHEDENDGSGIAFHLEQQKDINLQIEKPRFQKIAQTISIPAVVQSDPRFTSVVSSSSRGVLMLTDGKTISSVGRRVKKGDILGRIIPSADQQHWTSLMLDYEKADSDKELAEKELYRIKNLVEKGLLPDKNLLNAENRFNRFNAELKSAKSRKSQLYGAQKSSIALRASHNGVIKKISFRHGALVESGDIVFEIFSPQQIVIKGFVFQSDIRSIKDIQYAFLKTKDEIVKIDHVDDKILNDELVFDSETISATLEIAMKNQHHFTVGERVSLNLGIGEAKKSITVPLSSIVDINTKPYLFIRSGKEMFQQTAVNLGASNGERVAVVSGVDNHDEVVVSGGFEIYVSSLGSSVDPHAGHNH